MIYLNGQPIVNCAYFAQEFPSCKRAARIFSAYVERLCGQSLRVETEEKASVRFSIDEEADDCAKISLAGSKLCIGGGKRGVIYATYIFLEEYVGCRFFAQDVEVLPKGDIFLSAIAYAHTPKIPFRMYLGKAASEDEFCLKRKWNGMLWNTHRFGEAEGGGYQFAGTPAHTLTGDYLLKPYVESNPEYFALVNGERLTDRRGQVCMTLKAALSATVYEARKLLDENPDKPLISVSQGDNGNFCQCEKCAAAVKTQGLVKTYFQFVNDVAKELKKTHPKVLVHTLAYQKTKDLPSDLQFENNVLIQYCTTDWCVNHAITDITCAQNKKMRESFEGMTGKNRQFFIWDYLNCFRYQLCILPDLFYLPEKFVFLADNGVKGLFLEGEHRASDGYGALHELRAYLASLAAWGDCDKEKYLDRMREFIFAYYGSEKIYDLICEYVEACQSGHANYDLWRFQEEIDAAADGDVNPRKAAEIIRGDVKTLCASLLKKWEIAYATATQVQKERLERLQACLLWTELFYTMEETLANGSEAEKALSWAKNARLVELIFQYRLKLTFWGQSVESQLEQMEKEDYEHIPPSRWNYNW